MSHLTRHFADALDRKDFTDPVMVRSELAPDSVQYALRIQRWTDAMFVALRPTEEQELDLSLQHQRYAGLPIGYLAVAKANAVLSRNLHDQEHKKTAVAASNSLEIVAKQAAGLLLLSAEQQVHEGGFDIEQAFDDRLANLRERFNIPAPTQ